MRKAFYASSCLANKNETPITYDRFFLPSWGCNIIFVPSPIYPTLLLIWQDTYEYYSYKQTGGGRQGCSEGGIFLTLSILHGNGWQPPMNSLTLLISLGSLLVRVWFLTFGIRKNIWLKFQRSIPSHSTKNDGIYLLFFCTFPIWIRIL